MAKANYQKNEIKNASKVLEILLATDYISKKELYKANFLRGLFFGLGSFFGATIVIALILWILSLFDSFPFINAIKETLEKQL
jgi:hypothetical protein